MVEEAAASPDMLVAEAPAGAVKAACQKACVAAVVLCLHTDPKSEAAVQEPVYRQGAYFPNRQDRLGLGAADQQEVLDWLPFQGIEDQVERREPRADTLGGAHPEGVVQQLPACHQWAGP